MSDNKPRQAPVLTSSALKFVSHYDLIVALNKAAAYADDLIGKVESRNEEIDELQANYDSLRAEYLEKDKDLADALIKVSKLESELNKYTEDDHIEPAADYVKDALNFTQIAAPEGKVSKKKKPKPKPCADEPEIPNMPIDPLPFTAVTNFDNANLPQAQPEWDQYLSADDWAEIIKVIEAIANSRAPELYLNDSILYGERGKFALHINEQSIDAICNAWANLQQETPPREQRVIEFRFVSDRLVYVFIRPHGGGLHPKVIREPYHDKVLFDYFTAAARLSTDKAKEFSLPFVVPIRDSGLGGDSVTLTKLKGVETLKQIFDGHSDGKDGYWYEIKEGDGDDLFTVFAKPTEDIPF